MIDIILKPNTVGENPTGFHAQTVQSENRTTGDFIKTMTSIRGGVTEGECAQWLDLVVRSFIFELTQGRSINIKGFVNANVYVKGEFPSTDSPFDPTRNKIHGGINFSRAINKVLAGSPVRRVSDAASGLYIEHIHDIASGTEDRTLTPNMGVRVRGSKMKLVGSASTVGVFIEDEAGGSTQVAAAAIIRNGPTEIEFICPNLLPGRYRIWITTMYSGNSDAFLKDARSYIFPTILTVG
jgi:hypothetical protein